MVSGVAEILMVGSIVVGVANAILAVVLLALYGRTFRSTKAPFTVALVIFAAAFLLHNLLMIYSYTTMMPLVPYEMMPYLFGIAVLEAGGLGAMVGQRPSRVRGGRRAVMRASKENGRAPWDRHPATTTTCG